MNLAPLRTLNKPAHFLAVRQNGRVWHTPNFIFSFYNHGGQASDHAVGFIVTKKNFKKAVDRNRIKRKLRPILREILPIKAIMGDYVVIAKLPALDAGHETLTKDVLWALKKLDCLA